MARIEPFKDISIDWRLFTLPPDSNTKVSKIVISQGLEIDNLRFSMQFPVVEQKIRLQAPVNDNSKLKTEKQKSETKIEVSSSEVEKSENNPDL